MERTVFSAKTGAHSIQVKAKGIFRLLTFGTDELQSCVNLREPWKLQLDYTQWMVSALLLHPNPRRFLVFGLGGGGLPHFLLHHHSGSRIDVVEKEQLVIHLARSHFQLPDREGLRLICQDAATFLQTSDEIDYHVAFLDIFEPGSVPEDLLQPDFYLSILRRLTPRGVLSVNLWSKDNSVFRQALNAARIASQGKMLSMQVKKRGNIILLLFPHDIPWQTIHRVRKDNLHYLSRYAIDFATCFKSLRRRRFLPFFFP